MRYVARPVEVDAHEIIEVRHVVKTKAKSTYLILHGMPDPVKVTKAMMNRLSPKRGDYLLLHPMDDPQIVAKSIFETRYKEFDGQD